MPIEIKELHINVVVNPASGQQQAGNQTGGVVGSGGGSNVGDNDQLVAECVEQVLQILKHKMER